MVARSGARLPVAVSYRDSVPLVFSAGSGSKGAKQFRRMRVASRGGPPVTPVRYSIHPLPLRDPLTPPYGG